MKKANTLPQNALKWLPWGLTGFFAGLLNGLLGAAGGILLIFVLPHLPPPSGQEALSSALRDSRDLPAISLSVMLPVTALSLLLYWLGGNVADSVLAGVITIPAAAGGLLGAYLLGKLPRRFLQKLFGLLVAVAGIRMLMG